MADVSASDMSLITAPVSGSVQYVQLTKVFKKAPIPHMSLKIAFFVQLRGRSAGEENVRSAEVSQAKKKNVFLWGSLFLRSPF